MDGADPEEAGARVECRPPMSETGSRAIPARPATLAPLPGRPEAEATIWDWTRTADARDDPTAEAGRKRRHGVVQALATASAGAILFLLGLRLPAFLAREGQAGAGERPLLSSILFGRAGNLIHPRLQLFQ